MTQKPEYHGDVAETYEALIEHPDADDLPLARALDNGIKAIGHVVMWANLILMMAIIVQVVLRYALNMNFPKLDELQWHFYGLVTMIGVSYALTTDSHVRVDLLYMQLSNRAQRIVEIIGILFLLAPFIYLMIDQGYDYFAESYRVNERSSSATGLPFLWAFKALIPVSFVLLGIAALARLMHDVHAIVTRRDTDEGKGLMLPLTALLIAFVIAAGLSTLVETTEEMLVISMFLTFIGILFTGFPVAWALAGTGMIFAGLGYHFDMGNMAWTGLEDTFTGLDYLTLGSVVNRVYATMSNAVLVALPMFIFMGLMLDESGVAERLMTAMTRLFGTVRGGLAITVTLIGIILAASTGIVGASVVLLGVLSLPAMMQHNYSKSLATGVVAASGTLGILIPPSIMLVIMADQMALSVGDLFMAAALPGMLLGVIYLLYIFIIALLKPSSAPAPADAKRIDWPIIRDVIIAVLPPLALILSVLGSIFAGICTPTEASGIGAAGATLLALGYRKLTWAKTWNVLKATFNTTAYIFAIFLGATIFSFVLRELGGDELIESLVTSTGLGPNGTVIFILGIVFLLGFVLDWIEITLIVLPLMRPIVNGLGLDIPGFGEIDEPALIWFVILVAVALQTSFLTPPVGFSLFYLKGVCPPSIRLTDIYKGIVPFVLLQLFGLALVFMWPALTTWLPSVAY
ncbi:C4-dicarboxylate ABC transporter [Notoacmeibacter marinus]|uniref:C4-dicarboxylate ABC transporter n=1 Tax=Notoacmeibacter marinus TaxID=1876515 RepID=A0A231V0P8_9HYPH|nr:TRAP transporter large permease subunit [Notoacmeibacter marinus]OXT01611.1 C4-dicarboxylate ABC transporter [Notoacmeibacter marinus]